LKGKNDDFPAHNNESNPGRGVRGRVASRLQQASGRPAANPVGDTGIDVAVDAIDHAINAFDHALDALDHAQPDARQQHAGHHRQRNGHERHRHW
jgi:hypothetical protein